MQTEMTLILGGTGKTGRRVAQRLLARGVPIRIASRSVTPSFDWDKPGTWKAALDGVTSAYITYAPDLAIPGATETIRAFVEKALEHAMIAKERAPAGGQLQNLETQIARLREGENINP